MAKTNYQRGAMAERKAIDQLAKVGYVAARTAGSHGLFDVVAVGPTGVRLIQIKRVKEGSYRSELAAAAEQMAALPSPLGVSREIWVWRDGEGWVAQERV